METVSIPYFRELLAKHLAEFETSIHTWEKVSSSENIPEDVLDEIRSTIGLTNLLMKQKMKQFGELIDDSENKTGEKEITCVDLQGFWDMVYNEIEKIQKSFLKLEKCQKNNWILVEDPPIVKVEIKKKENKTLNPKVENAAKERAIAARQRIAEAKLKMKSKFTKKTEEPIEILIAKPDKPIKAIGDQAKGVDEIEEKEESPRKRSKRSNVLSTKTQDGLIQTEDSDNAQNKIKSGKVSSKKKDKENSLPISKKDTAKNTLYTPNEKSSGSSSNSKKTPRETIPLQCMTRSAKKALLAKENALKGK